MVGLPTQWDIRRGVTRFISLDADRVNQMWTVWLFGFTVLLAMSNSYTTPPALTHIWELKSILICFETQSPLLSPGTNKNSSWYEIVTLTQLKINKNMGEKLPRYSYSL